MGFCELNTANNIPLFIKNFIYSQKNKITIELIEDYIKEKIRDDSFTIASYLGSKSIGDKQKKSLETILAMKGLYVEPFIEKNFNNVINKFSNQSVDNLFHTLPAARGYFENWTNNKIINAAIIGNKDTDFFVRDDADFSKNMADLKQELFSTIHKFLVQKGILKKDSSDKLYDSEYQVDYENYLLVLNASKNYFFSEDNFSQISSRISDLKIPNLPYDISKNLQLYDAYNASVLLVNFDSIMISNFHNIMQMNYEDINSLKDPIRQDKKRYTLNIEGLKTLYWNTDDHESESSEHMEDSLTKLIVNSIPAYNKLGQPTLSTMEMRDLYLLAAKISNFELLYGNSYINSNKGFVYFNNDSSKRLDWYIDAVLNGKDQLIDREFSGIKEIFISLNEYYKNSNINKKEDSVGTNKIFSVKNIITQVINNNFGASYTTSNSNGKFLVREMYKYDFDSIKFQEWTAKKISDFSENVFKEGSDFWTDFEKLFSGIDNNILAINISEERKKNIGVMLKKYLGSFATIDILNTTIKILESSYLKTSEVYTVENLKQHMKDMFLQASSDWKTIKELFEENKDNINLSETEESGTSQFIPALIKNLFYKSFQDAWLSNSTVKAQMYIETRDKRKIPTFKSATLTYKDTELFELQREFEKDPKRAFKSLALKNIPMILGTGTKLEIIHKDNNKNTVKSTISESFSEEFFYEFLGNLNKTGNFSVVLGNYSDKNTVLTKIINGNFTNNDTFVTELSSEEIQELMRTQGFNFYKDSILQVLNDYKRGFEEFVDAVEGFPKEISDLLNVLKKINFNSSVTDILNANNELFKVLNLTTIINGKAVKVVTPDILTQLYYSSKKSNLGLTEELHYSSYANGIGPNQNLLHNFFIYSSKENFKEFAKREEDKVIQDFKKFVNEEGTLNYPKEIKENLSKVLGLLKLKKGEYGNIENEGRLNPLISKWLWLNNLYRSEYWYISSKGTHMHPHKNKQIQYKEINLEDSKDLDFWKRYDEEVSGRLSSMAKRNVIFTAIIESPVKNTNKGVPDDVNLAVVRDFLDTTFNISGAINSKLETHNGSTFLEYSYSKMIDSSFPGKGYKGTKKQFGTLITPSGITIKKDAENVITNKKILDSMNSPISLINYKRKMLGVTIKDSFKVSKNPLFKKELTNYSIIRNGELISYVSVSIKKTLEGLEASLTERTPNGIKVNKLIFTNLFQLWEFLGGEFTVDASMDTTEDSNELLFEIVTSIKNENGEYSLKNDMIHAVSNISAIKAGAMNVNPSETLFDSVSDWSFTTYKSRFMGPQLDASHELDSSKIKEVTQVISALAQNPTTAHLAEEAYRDIANVIKKSMKNYEKFFTKTSIDKEELYRFLASKFVNAVKNSKGDTIAKTLIHSLDGVINIPFSNQNFFTAFVRDIITRMNNDFITRYYNGTGAVIVPSHGIIQMYDVPIFNENSELVGYRTVKQSDLIKEALKTKVTGLSNKEIINNYINGLLKDVEVNTDTIQIGDRIRDSLGNEVYLKDPKTYYQFKEQYKEVKVKRVLNKPRDLKPGVNLFSISNMGIVENYNTFDLDSVNLRFNLEYNNLSEDNKIIKEWLKNKFNLTEGKELNKFINSWTQRQLELLEQGIPPVSVIKLKNKLILNNPSISDEVAIITALETIFGEDNIIGESFKDVKDHYIDLAKTQGLTFLHNEHQRAELLIGNMYNTVFGGLDKVSMAKIEKEGSTFFYKRLLNSHTMSAKEKKSGANLKLIINGYEKPIYIKFVDKLPPHNTQVSLVKGVEGYEEGFTRLNYKGEVVYSIPPNQINKSFSVEETETHETIYIKDYLISKESEKNTAIYANFVNSMSNKNLKEGIPQNQHSLKIINDLVLETFSNLIQIKDVGNYWDKKSDILTPLSKKMYASWDKSREFIAARIPSQSMQSFMAMKNVGYLEDSSNDAYVSVWQIWIQGSDFDIDKAYMLGNGFLDNGLFDNWANRFNYSTKKELDAITKLPLPSGKELKQSPTEKGAINLSNLMVTFTKSGDIEGIDNIEKVEKVLRLISTYEESQILVYFDETIEKNAALEYIKFINKYNNSTSYLKKENAVKNSVVSRINSIITSPANEIFATAPVDDSLDEWIEAGNSVQKEKYLMSPHNMFGFYKQQRDAMVGKDDVGISANGLKALFALSTYFNQTLNDNFVLDKTSLKLFKRSFKYTQEDFKIDLNLSTISDIDLSRKLKKSLQELMGKDITFRYSQAALNLSGFTTAATDNAKVLLMSKINASVELASMHIYMMILGFTPIEISNMLTSPIMAEVVKKLDSNMLEGKESDAVNIIFNSIISKIPAENVIELENAKTLKNIFEGGQELKLLARLLGVNQKTSANIEEIHKFLSTFETILFARENIIFEGALRDLKDSLKVGKDFNKIKYDNSLLEASKKIILSNPERFNEKDIPYIISILERVNNVEVADTDDFGNTITENGVIKTKKVSLIGNFDYRLYTSTINDAIAKEKETLSYKEATKIYYDLIKSTFNIFDVVDTVPHFKRMIEGVVLSHNILLNSSLKYNAAFNILKDTVRDYGSNIVFSGPKSERNNPHVGRILGNSGLGVKIDDINITKVMLYIDTILRESWLRDSERTKGIRFDLIALMEKFKISSIKVYKDDSAYQNLENTATVLVTDKDSEFRFVDLQSNHGIANFKLIMEKILLPGLQENYRSDFDELENAKEFLELLKVGSMPNAFGINGSAIMPTFRFTDKNIPMLAIKYQRLLKAFNDLDVNTSENLQIPGNFKWRDLFFLYNLLVNNEKYGEKRITPILEDYLKENSSLGVDFIKFSAKLDSGEFNPFSLEYYLSNNERYSRLLANQNEYGRDDFNKFKEEIVDEAKETRAKDILYFAYNSRGILSYGNSGLSNKNADFVIVSSMSEDINYKKVKEDIRLLKQLIRDNNFLIYLDCK